MLLKQPRCPDTLIAAVQLSGPRRLMHLVQPRLSEQSEQRKEGHRSGGRWGSLKEPHSQMLCDHRSLLSLLLSAASPDYASEGVI